MSQLTRLADVLNMTLKEFKCSLFPELRNIDGKQDLNQMIQSKVGFLSGTLAQRPLVGNIGDTYYQTDGYFGKYYWDGTRWVNEVDEYQIFNFWPSASIYVPPGVVSGGGTTSVSGGSSLTGFIMSVANTGALSMFNTGFSVFNSNTILAMRGSCYLTVLSNDTDQYTLRYGTVKNDGTTPIRGSWFEYTHNVNGGNWRCLSTNNTGADTEITNTNIPLGLLTDEQELCIFQDGITSVKFYINNVLVATHTAQIPNGNLTTTEYLGSYSLQKNAGTGAITHRVRLMAAKRKSLDLL